MNTQHLIDNAIFDTSYHDYEISSVQQSEVENFIKTNLMSTIDEIFTEFSNSGTVFRIDELELDLGSIPFHDYKFEMDKRLREQLLLKLEETQRRAKNGQSSKNNIIDVKSAAQDELFYFLSKGHLPWYSRLKGENVLESILIQTLDSNPEDFKYFIRQSSKKIEVIERLISQFSIDINKRIYSLFTLSSIGSVDLYLSEFKLFLRRRDTPFALSNYHIEQVMEDFWETLITLAVNKNDSFTNSEAIFKSALKACLFNRFEINSTKLAEYKKNISKSKSVSSGFNAIIESLINESDSSCVKSQEKDYLDFTQKDECYQFNIAEDIDGCFFNIDKQYFKFIDALVIGNKDSIQSYWSAVYNEHSEQLTLILQYYGQQTKIRKFLSFALTKSMFHDVLVLLEPTEEIFIRSIIENNEIFFDDKEFYKANSVQHTAEVKEFTLSYLLVERGSQFNKKSYLGSLIRQMSSSTNQNVTDLILHLSISISSLSKTNKVARSVLRLLTEIRQEFSIDLKKQESSKIIHKESYESYKSLKDTFDENNHDCQESGLIQSILMLEKYNSSLLMRLFYDLHKSHSAKSLNIDNISTKVLHHLIISLLSIGTKTENTFQIIDLINKIMVYETNSYNKRASYIYIFNCLLEEEAASFVNVYSNINTHVKSAAHQLNKIKNSIPSISSSDVIKEKTFIAHSSKLENLTLGQIREGIVDNLNGAHIISSNMQTELAHSFEYLYKQYPGILRQILAVDVDNAHFMSRLVDLLPLSFQDTLFYMLGVSRESVLHTLKNNSIKNRGLVSQDVNNVINPDTVKKSDLQYETKESIEKRITDLLSGSDVLSADMQEELARRFDYLYKQNTDFLLQIIESNLETPHFVSRLVELLPVSFQDKLLILLGVSRENVLSGITNSGLKHIGRVLRNNYKANKYRDIGRVDIKDEEKEFAQKIIVKSLKGSDVLPIDMQAKLIHLFEYLYEENTTLLRQIVMSNLDNLHFMSRLFDLLPVSFQDALFLMLGVSRTSVLHTLDGAEYKYSSIVSQDFKKINNTTDINKSDVEHKPKEFAEKIIIESLTGVHVLSADKQEELVHSLEYLCEHHSNMLRKLLKSELSNAIFIKRLVNVLPESLHLKLLESIGLVNSVSILKYSEIINAVCTSREIGISGELLERFKWQFIYSSFEKSGLILNEKYFIQQYVVSLIKKLNITDRQEFLSLIKHHLSLNSLSSDHELLQMLINTLSPENNDISVFDEDVSNTEINKSAYKNKQEDADIILDDIYIHNAGIVLAAVYLPRLFDMLGLLDKTQFKDRESAEKGIYALQFLVNEKTTNPEHHLVLNKLLCGVKTGRPIKRSVKFSDEDKEHLESLLYGIIEHWKSLGKTSISGLRESFLKRNGRLQLIKDAWHLSVEPKSFDILLDNIPWSYSTIKLPWMDRVIYVTWR